MNFQSRPYQVFPKPVPPLPVGQLGAVCITFDKKWLPYLLGAISQLAIDRTWESQNERSTGEARNLLDLFAGALACPEPEPGGLEMDDCMGCCIRIQDGKLQVLSCGEWTTVPGGDLSELIGGTGSPAQGAPQPDAGGCESFKGKVLFFGRWLLPVPVSTNDVITVTNALGSTTDYIVDFPAWRCGDGTVFFAGGCVSGTEIFAGGDPAPAFHHGNLIAFDGTNYYDCGPAANSMTATITIPAGITNQNLTFLINAPGPAGAGDISFDVRICKAAAGPIFLTYVNGTGPAGVSAGDVFTVNSTCCGGGGPLDEQIWMQFSETVHLECLNQSNYTPSWVGSATWMEGEHPIGTFVQVHTDPYPGTTPTVWNPATLVDGWLCDEGAGGVPWSAQFRLTR